MSAAAAQPTVYLLGLVALLVGLPVAAQAPKPSPPFTGDALPQPPAQQRPWEPGETKLPAAFVTAAEFLFRAGLADPRGCQYRAIEVGTGNCWSGDAGVVQTHGWVLPAAEGQKARFAVCWNGLVYPLVSVGEPRDLAADVNAAVQADEEYWAKVAREHGPQWVNRLHHAWPEGESVAHTSLLPLKAALLLRLGEEKLSARLWETWAAGLRPNTNDNDRDLKDPFLVLATDWTWALFDRAVCAHMRGDDGLALVSLEALIPAAKKIEAEAARRGLERPSDGNGGKRPYLSFLTQAEELLADQRRRARAEGGAGPPPGREKDQAGRIALLIRRLDDVAARQWGQPGGVSLNTDDAVQGLIREGGPAVGPLLECLGSDGRLTRSVEFHRDFFHHRRVLTVGEAAYEALAGILGTRNFGPDAPAYPSFQTREDRKEFAGAVRNYWARFQGFSEALRWYALLADDRSTQEQWLEAAESLARLKKGSPAGTWPLDEAKAKWASVLMGRRAAAMPDGAAAGSEQFWAVGRACRMALHLADWDPKAAVPVLRRQIEVTREWLEGPRGEGHDRDALVHQTALMFQARRQAGDEWALADYGDWLRHLKPEHLRWRPAEPFRLLWENADDPAMQTAAAALFGQDESPWAAYARSQDLSRTRELMQTPLLGLKPFRERILEGLQDKTPVGHVTLSEGGGMTLSAGGVRSGTGYCPEDPLSAEVGSELTLRRCDLVAWNLVRLDGLPRVEPHWREPARDQAIAELARTLRRYGDRFGYAAGAPGAGGEEPTAAMTFPPLPGPAEPGDVLLGAAVFALDGGEVRQVRLPARPLAARWTALKKYPRSVQWYKPATGESGTRVEYAQDGAVWQAEEVFRGGRWHRYYGFVGPGAPAKVPAEEIEFPEPGWSELSGGLDCKLEAAGGPARLRLRVRNRKGVELSIPDNFYRKNPQSGVALLAGVTLRVEYRPRGQGAPAGPDGDEGWVELQPKQVAVFRDGSPRPLREARERTALEFDLGDFVDASRPGEYRVVVRFGGAGAFAEGESDAVVIHRTE